MKKMLCTVLILSLSFVFPSVSNAATPTESLPIIDSQTECLEHPHIHSEDIIDIVDESLSITPFAEIHCEKNGRPGLLFTSTSLKTVGSQNRNCGHGRVGGIDKRLQYQKTTKYSCNGCSYSYSTSGNPYWGAWNCQ